MNFKTIGLNVAVATTVVAGSAIAVSPAHALSLNGSLSLSGGANLSSNSISFTSSKVNAATGDFASLVGSSATIKPLSVSSSTLQVLGPVNRFIDFGSFTVGSTTSNLFFNLASSPAFSLSNSTGAAFLADIAGSFEFNGQTLASGFLNASRAGSSGSYNISLAATPVPAPAILPGLIGLGLGIARKRKSALAEQSEA